MHRAPRRPTYDVSAVYNDGVVTVCSVEDTARPGYAPVKGLTPKVTLRYSEQRLGIQRYYEGRQNQVEIERVIRTPRRDNVSSQDVAVTEDGKRYRIDMVQAVMDVYPPSMDLTLAKIEQRYEVSGHDVV